MAALLVDELQPARPPRGGIATPRVAALQDASRWCVAPLNRLAEWIDAVLRSVERRPMLSSLELARTVMALSQGFAQQPADRARVKQLMRQVLGRLFAG